MLTTPWISRLVAVLLLLVAITLLYIVIVEPTFAAYRNTRLAIEETRNQVHLLEELAALRPALGEQAEALKQRLEEKGAYLSGGTDALAAVALQDRLQDAVKSEGGTIRSIQPLPVTDEGGFRRVAVRVQMAATIGALFNICYELEGGAPLLFIENVDVQSRMVRRADANQAQDAEEPVLAIGFDLLGYMPIEAP